MKKVLFVSFESLPFVKTGGLADVVYALPRALDKSEFEVKVVLPLSKKPVNRYTGISISTPLYKPNSSLIRSSSISAPITQSIPVTAALPWRMSGSPGT